MSLHQIIYTSCRRGIDGVNDGQQVYSYDSSLTDPQKEEVKPLFTYTQPRLPEGQEMTDEVAKTMPRSLTYLQFSTGDCAVALNTYLGRDYMGAGGRFGNHLAHVILADEPDFTLYPCEMIHSPALRSSMSYDEVNSAQKPDYLPIPSLIPGDVVTLDTVLDFLQSDEDHMFFYKRMVDAMLRGKEEKKRLVICDTPDNLILWIGALNYTLPQVLAKQIGFTTYTADPSLSRALICGVLPEGTNYSANEYCNSGNFFVFDFIHQSASPDEYADNPFIDFIDTAFSFSVDSLEKFHTFLINNTSYRSTDTDLYNGYDLYRLVTQGMDDITENQFSGVADFADKYCNKGMSKKICEAILGIKSKLSTFDNSYIMKMFQFLLKHFQEMGAVLQTVTKNLILDHILNLLRNPDIQPEDYSHFYSGTDEMARSIGLSIPAELISGDKKKELEDILYGRNPNWKIYQIVDIFCGYVKDSHLPVSSLSYSGNPGGLFYTIIEAFYSTSPQNGQEAAEHIMSSFASDSRYFVGVTLAMEENLYKLKAPQAVIDGIWRKFDKVAQQYSGVDADRIFDELVANKKYESLYRLYSHKLDAAHNLHEKDQTFIELINKNFHRYPEYKRQYYLTAIRDYVKEIENYQPSNEDEEDGKNHIFQDLSSLCIHEKINDPVTDKVINHALDNITLYKQSDSDIHFVRQVVELYNQSLKKNIEGRLLLLYSWDVLDRYEKRGQIKDFIKEIHQSAGNNTIDIGQLNDDKERKKCVKRFTEFPARVQPESEILMDYYNLFHMTPDVHDYFFNEIRKAYSSKEKGSIVCETYIDFIRFLGSCGSDADIEEAGAALSGLKPEQLNDMDYQIEKLLKKELKTYRLWQDVKDKAGRTNSFTHAFGSVFNKFRKDK